MGLLGLDVINTEVTSSLGTRTNLDSDRVDTWINLAYVDIASGIDFEELDGELVIPTVVSQNNYTAPVNPLAIQLLRDDTNDHLLAWVPKSEFFRLDQSVIEAAPARWTRKAAELLIWPNPNKIYSLTSHFKITPTLLTGAATTILPAYVDNALIMLGAAYGFLAVGEDNRAIVWVNRAAAFLGSRLTNQDFSFLLGGLAHTQPSPSSELEASASGT